MEQSVTLERFDTAPGVVAVMTRDEAAESERRILSLTTDLRAELLRFYEGRGWAALGYGSWRAWGASRLGQSENMAYRELMAGRLEVLLFDDSQKVGTVPETHLRPLAPLRNDPNLLRDTWEDAHEIASERGEKFAARHVEEAVKAVTAPEVFPQHNLAPAAPVAARAVVLTPMPTQPAPARPAPMAVHFSSASPEHYTPAHIIALAREVMGEIDLDPASCAAANEIVGANHWYGLDHPNEAMRDGLSASWFGRVWMNPPYGDEIGLWMHRLVHQCAGDDPFVQQAIALVPARTDTAWFHDTTADCTVCFVRGRLKFGSAESSAPFPSALVYFGENVEAFVTVFSAIGQCRPPVARV